MITLYQFEISPYCDKIRRLMNWKRIAYRIVEVPVTGAGRIRKLNPIGKLPCIEDGSTVVCDSTEIAYYLEERYPDPPVIPAGARDRALCHVLEDWADESLYFYEMALRFTVPANAAKTLPRLLHADPALVQRLGPLLVPRALRGVLKRQGVGRKSLAQILTDVERHVGAVSDLLAADDGWLIGSRLSLADLAVFTMFTCIRETPEGARLIDAEPAVGRWLERVDTSTRSPHSPAR